MSKVVQVTGVLALVSGSLLLSACGLNGKESPSAVSTPVQAANVWASRADTAQKALQEHFWSPTANYFHKDNKGDASFNYWWQAHALDALCDAYSRTKDEQYLTLMNSLHDGVRAKNGNTFENNYYDDMEWMALACLRAYQLTGDEKYRATVDTLWTDIKTGWSDYMGGGISWKKDQRDYKNTPANAPASILAARLYQLDQKPEDLEWALKIYDWQQRNLVDPATGLVWDGKNRQGDNKIDKDWKFTYCQGVYIGAGLELYKITKQQEYLDASVRTADYVLSSTDFTKNGVLLERGKGDGGLFKGILIRYLTQLALSDYPSSESRNRYKAFIASNGEVLWHSGTHRPTLLFGESWGTQPPADQTDSSVQLSGVMLTEALALLEQEEEL
ncbi:putative alpha-1,6-mannanase (GH76 family) [Pontibacter ummariensis]|uniref:Predicted alpha-1,6-mannanase, GH76 family n=1 Tax=Pontibacter ummariensis TaxID=1610492 RepID=A0A239G5B8_9BACT|nr:glycoside hydrolase family 76 protein [Pontibacter ummariensis]PRY11673.1 putative alpha-1,6-mannanase (GH76 family) [Pontibacter ummariensis]SNS63214.1 Predicted alpha-1,6-mannanase, GH76 family [Pontibacter ummariensis]